MDASIQETNRETFDAHLEQVIAEAREGLKRRQRDDGHFLFDLEADATIPAEYIFLNHYLDEREPELEERLARYLRSIQDADGGWPLFHRGPADLSATVKAYYALKMVGDDPEAPHMRRARNLVLSMGGAERSNVFTRYALALFGEVPWKAVPVMPVELMLMPRWFPVTIWRMSYWSRTVIAPLLILAALKPKAINPTGATIRELFRRDPDIIDDWQQNPGGGWIGRFFLGLDRVLRVVEPHFPKGSRRRAMKAAEDFFIARLNGEDGLGAIFPAMANSVMAMEALGYPKDDPRLVTAKKSIRLLVTPGEGETFVQPCVSPIWDTGLAAHALMEAGEAPASPVVKRATDWLKSKQILDVKGDWAVNAPDLEPGGWAFQYANDYYPDVDDTAVVAMALHRTQNPEYDENIDRAAKWIEGMQSSNGGWGAFDIDNDDDYLNYIPFADHGALLDPPTEDVSARCLSFLAQLGRRRDHPAVSRAITYLKKTQQPDGSWYGRWGTNYIYGTWSVLSALNAVGEDMQAPHVRRAVEWLLARQNEDGGWGESGESYWEEKRDQPAPSTASQTAWALLALMAAGEVAHPAVRRGVEWLLAQPREDNGDRWVEPWYTAVGFPRVFYLRYHGYAAYFPLWALARYRRLRQANEKKVAWGI
ncbi:MAG: squalene--hopene cyclase [Alphaproteobacteria bacterium]|nr:MAG: squalene--hopene cyclase [Alphaproteobacteria bacterium]